MAYKSSSRRQYRKLAKKSKRNFFITVFLIILVMYLGLLWGLPVLINGVTSVKNYVKPVKKTITESPKNSSLAPPVLNIPYEATNTAEINIRGYGTPNSKVAIYLEDDKKDTTEVSADGVFEVKNISLSFGTNNIYGSSVDENNLESLPSKTLKIIYDNETPKLNISEPEDDKKIQGGDKKIKISGNTEVGAHVYINESQAVVNSEGKFSEEFSLNDGDNNFNIKTIDEASNATEVSRKVTFTP